MPINWNEFAKETTDIFVQQLLPVLQQSSEETKKRLEWFAKDLARFLELSLLGDPAAQLNAVWLRSEMAMILARYSNINNSAAQRAMDAWIDVLLKVLTALIKAAL